MLQTTKIPQTIYGGMGMRMGSNLKLTGLLLTMSCLTIHHSLNPLGPSWSRVLLVESAAPVASHTVSFMHCPPLDTSSTPDTIVLPPGLVSTLLKAISPEILGTALCMVVSNLGTTNHMLPDCTAFISYKSVCNLSVCMGSNSYPQVLGWGTAISLSMGNACLFGMYYMT
jgi:hypothetical protein